MLGLVMVSSRFPGGLTQLQPVEERVEQSINTQETCESLNFNDDYVVTLRHGVHRLHYLQSHQQNVCFQTIETLSIAASYFCSQIIQWERH